jgi:hypothetical protein
MRVIVAVVAAVVAGALGWYLYDVPTELPAPSVGGGSTPQRPVSPIEPATPTSHAVTSRHSSERTNIRTAATPVTSVTSLGLTPAVATSTMLRDLDLDLGAMREIRRLIGSSDRVVLVENTVDRQTCLQIVCEGGDARSIVCSAPAPSPRYVTQPDGKLVFAIERAGESTSSATLVPVRVMLDGAPVLMWYDDVPTVRSVVGDGRSCAPCQTTISADLRPDRSVHVAVGSVMHTIGRIRLLDTEGRPRAGADPAWHIDGTGNIEVSARGMAPGLYELRLESTTSAPPVRMLLIVR